MQGFLGLAPGFARGAEGFGIAEGLGRQAASGELAALQASMLLRGSKFEGGRRRRRYARYPERR